MSTAIQVVFSLPSDQEETPNLDICSSCACNDGTPCVMKEICANARYLALKLTQDRINAQLALPKGRCADYVSGYQFGNMMALNVVCDMLSGRLEAVMNLAAREEGA